MEVILNRIIRHPTDITDDHPGRAQRSSQFAWFYKFSPIMGAARQPAQHVFGPHDTQGKGFCRPVECRQRHRAARSNQCRGIINEGLQIGHMFDHFHIHDGIELFALRHQIIGGCVAIADV